jgi:16S rRNA (guanine(966)-N(2))-methyltransferase RsmD
MSRIIAGTARGRRLVAPKGNRTRPTSDKVRGAIFNLLGQFFEGGVVLDLYAGTGALALEALSRGCARAVCVEAERPVAELIRRNSESCGFADRLEVLSIRVDAALARLPAEGFDLVFIDPPYADGPEAALAAVGRVVRAGGRVVAEHDARRPPPEQVVALELADRRGYGDTGVSIYVRR